MPRYRKKPVEIEARQMPGLLSCNPLSDVAKNKAEDLARWCNGEFVPPDETVGQPYILIHTLEGQMKAMPDDWIIKGVQGEFYPCKPDIFAATYDAADPPATVPAGAMSFGHAIEAMKAGHKVARAGWNGKGMFIVLDKGGDLAPLHVQVPPRKTKDRTEERIGYNFRLEPQPYFAMYNAAKQWQPGWLASQSDMLADDWGIV